MGFVAYSSSGGPVSISYKERDESAGVLGVLTTTQSPIGEASTRDEITEIAFAYLGRDPTGSVYIADSQNHLLKIVINDKYHKDLASQATSHFMAWALLFFCFVCFVGTLLLGLHWTGLIGFLSIAALYIAFVRLKIQNEVESAVLLALVLLLILVLVPAVRAARARRIRTQDPTPAGQARTQEPAAEPVSDEVQSPPARR